MWKYAFEAYLESKEPDQPVHSHSPISVFLHCLLTDLFDTIEYISVQQIPISDCILADLGPVAQSIISLTSLLRVISLTVLADSIFNILIVFAEKMWVAFALQKLLTFFQQKISKYLGITRRKF